MDKESTARGAAVFLFPSHQLLGFYLGVEVRPGELASAWNTLEPSAQISSGVGRFRKDSRGFQGWWGYHLCLFAVVFAFFGGSDMLFGSRLLFLRRLRIV